MIRHAHSTTNAHSHELDPPAWTRSSPSCTRCATPSCHERRGHGLHGCFCASCAAFLARIREQLAHELSRTGSYAKRRDQREASMRLGSTCCEPGCEEPRDHPAMLCEWHLMAEAA